MLTKLLTKRVPYTFIRGGYYYFSRRVPADLRQHYSYHRVVQGLQTSSLAAFDIASKKSDFISLSQFKKAFAFSNEIIVG